MDRMSAYYMMNAAQKHFEKKNPDQKQLVGEICEAIRAALKVEEPSGVWALTGGIGQQRAWDDYFREMELNKEL